MFGKSTLKLCYANRREPLSAYGMVTLGLFLPLAIAFIANPARSYAAEDGNTNGIPDEWEEYYFQEQMTVGFIGCGSNVTFESPAIVVEGEIAANGNVLKTCSMSPTVYGDVSAGGSIEVFAVPGLGYTNYPGAPPFVLPEYRPFGIWYDLAVDAGLHYGSNTEFGVVDLQPANGVIYVEGDVSFGSNS